MVNKAELRQFIMQYFSDVELDELCFDYYPDLLNDFTTGLTKSQKVIALIGYAERRDRMDHLLTTLSKLRSQAFEKRFEPPAPAYHPKATTLKRDPDQVFISHAGQDAEFARRLAADLRRNDIRIWIAPDSIEPGEKWVDAINRGLETSRIFLLVMTSHAANSKWVKDETGYAIALENREEMRFITLDVGEGLIPPLWSVRQYISFREDYGEGLRQLLAALRPDRFAARSAALPVATAAPSAEKTKPKPETQSASETEDKTQEAAAKTAATPEQVSTIVSPGQTPAVNPARGKPLYWALGLAAVAAVTFLGWQLMSGGTEAGNIRTVSRGGVKVEQVFIPAGSFLMGNDRGSEHEKPVHEVTLDAFWLDRTEVTNTQFEKFVADTGHRTTAEREGGGHIYTDSGFDYKEGTDWLHPQGSASTLDGLGHHPVVLVSWDDATTFCEWAGGRLPTEAEWEYAARGPDSRVYPWGDAFDGTRLNYCDQNCPFNWADQTVDDGYEFTAPVEGYSNGASWIGSLNMAGNVGEWVKDRYSSEYYINSPGENPPGPALGESRVLRGGAWGSSPYVERSSDRNAAPTYDRFDYIGFRCAQE